MFYFRRENRPTYMQLHTEIRCPVDLKQMYDQQITYLSSNQRPTADPCGLLFMLFHSQKTMQHKRVGVLIVCHFLSSLS